MEQLGREGMMIAGGDERSNVALTKISRISSINDHIRRSLSTGSHTTQSTHVSRQLVAIFTDSSTSVPTFESIESSEKRSIGFYDGGES